MPFAVGQVTTVLKRISPSDDRSATHDIARSGRSGGKGERPATHTEKIFITPMSCDPLHAGEGIASVDCCNDFTRESAIQRHAVRSVHLKQAKPDFHGR